MTTILVIEASARISRSLSREMAQYFKAEWSKIKPEDQFIYRDVGSHPPPFISEAWIAACFTPVAARDEAAQEILKYSDEVIAEIRQAEIIVIATPMYNYGMPAVLKAWFDQVVRIDQTFSFSLERGDWPVEPLLGGKQLVILSSHGEFGFAPGGIRIQWDHMNPHIRTLAKFIGAKDIYESSIEYQEFGGERFANSVAASKGTIEAVVTEIASKF